MISKGSFGTLDQITKLHSVVRTVTFRYIDAMKGKKITNLYDFILEEVEPALLKATIESFGYNQSRTAKILGISRVTLRVKLAKYFDDQYFRSKKLDEMMRS